MVNGDKNNVEAEPIYLAAEGGHWDAVKALLNNSAYIVGGSPLFSSALAGAASSGHLDVVQYLVQNGRNADWDSLSTESPLSLASLVSFVASSGHLDVVQYFVQNGANVDGDSHLTASP